MSMRSAQGWRTETWMNRTLVIVVALSVFFSIGPLADEIPSGFDPGSSKAKGLILTFEDWPPDGVDTDPLLQKLHSARPAAGSNQPLCHAGPMSMRSPQGSRFGPPAAPQLTQTTG